MIAWFIDWSIDWLIEVCPGLQITYQNVMCGSSGVPCSTSMHVYVYNTTFQFLRGVGLIVNNKIIGMDTAWSMANGVVQIYPSTSSIAMFMRDEEVMILWSDSKWGQLPFLPCYLSHRIFFFLFLNFFFCLFGFQILYLWTNLKMIVNMTSSLVHTERLQHKSYHSNCFMSLPLLSCPPWKQLSVFAQIFAKYFMH